MRLSPSSLLDDFFAPAPEPGRVERLIPLPFAHRGLHGHGRIENSLAAFEAAIERGHGIELDVQGSRFGDAFVFHDYELDRLTDGKGELRALGYEDVLPIRLKGTKETIPTLLEVLGLISSRVPLLIEIKARDRGYHQLCYSVALALQDYSGAVGVMSFHPEVPRWFSRHFPDIVRGLVVTEAGEPERGSLRRRLALWRARPDFLAYDVRDLPSRFAARARARGVPVFTWTCRGEEQVKHARANADQIIYEDAA